MRKLTRAAGRLATVGVALALAWAGLAMALGTLPGTGVLRPVPESVAGVGTGASGGEGVVVATDSDAGFIPSVQEVEMAVGILTSPDYGTSERTYRFVQPTVTYRIDAHYPADYLGTIHAAFAYAGRHTGLVVTETSGEADIVVVAKGDNGARTKVWPRSDGSIDRVELQLGCCRARAAYEDVLQSFGPTGDKADGRSVFSNDLTGQVTPSAFDAWVLELLYSLPAGSGADAVRAAALG